MSNTKLRKLKIVRTSTQPLRLEEGEQMPVASSAPHWQPVRSTREMASMARRSPTLGLWPPHRCGGRSGSSGTILSQRASGILH